MFFSFYEKMFIKLKESNKPIKIKFVLLRLNTMS